jgi:hypothetical protein
VDDEAAERIAHFTKQFANPFRRGLVIERGSKRAEVQGRDLSEGQDLR